MVLESVNRVDLLLLEQLLRLLVDRVRPDLIEIGYPVDEK